MCYVWLSGSSSQVWVTQRPGEDSEPEYQDTCLVPKFPKKNSIMVSGGILAGKNTPLVLWDKNNLGTITVKSYIDTVLIPALQPFWHQQSEQGGQPLWLREDGASAYRARFITQALEQYGIRKFTLPPSSPNLNPIENVWYILTDMLIKHSPRPQGLDGMANAIKEEWQNIDKVDLLTFMDFMPERIEAIIAASGGHTPW